MTNLKIATVQSFSMGFFRDGSLAVWFHLDYHGHGQNFAGLRIRKDDVPRFMRECPKVAGVNSIENLIGRILRVEQNDQGEISRLAHCHKDSIQYERERV